MKNIFKIFILIEILLSVVTAEAKLEYSKDDAMQGLTHLAGSLTLFANGNVMSANASEVVAEVNRLMDQGVIPKRSSKFSESDLKKLVSDTRVAEACPAGQPLHYMYAERKSGDTFMAVRPLNLLPEFIASCGGLENIDVLHIEATGEVTK